MLILKFVTILQFVWPNVSVMLVFQEWVFVTHVANPNHFYIRRVAEKRAGVLLARKINTFCSGERGFFVSDDDLVTGNMKISLTVTGATNNAVFFSPHS